MTTLLRFGFASLLLAAAPAAHAQLGGMLNKAKQAAGSTGTASPSRGDMIQPDACISNVQSRLQTINDVYYPQFQANQRDFVAKEGTAWFARKDYLTAVYIYTSGAEGFKPGGRICDGGAATADPRWRALAPELKTAEAKVLEIEKAKNLLFVRIEDNNNIIFKDLKTGNELSASDSNKR